MMRVKEIGKNNWHIVDKHHIQSKAWRDKNIFKFRESLKKYAQTDKGQQAFKRRSLNRLKNFEKACENFNWEENDLIQNFYNNCPEGYCVDHIIPISKGGKHTLTNLQYLTPEENFRKGNKLDWKKYD